MKQEKQTFYYESIGGTEYECIAYYTPMCESNDPYVPTFPSELEIIDVKINNASVMYRLTDDEIDDLISGIYEKYELI